MIHAGKDGEIRFGTTVENTTTYTKVGYIDNFSLSIDDSAVEASQLGQNWKNFIETQKGWSGSASGTLDYADTQQKAMVDAFLSGTTTKVKLAFKLSDELTVAGDVFLTNVQVGASVSDKITVSFSFTGDGALAKVTA